MTINMNENDVINLVLSLHDITGEYSKNVGVTLISIFENTSSRIKVHLLHDETLSEFNKKKFVELIDAYQSKIEFYQIKISVDNNKYKAMKHLSKGALYRFYIPELIQEKKAIYLDSDLIIALDILELWQESVGNKALGVIKDPWFQKSGFKLSFYQKIFEIEKYKYFNSGVLVMNLNKIRKDYNFLEENFKFLDQYSEAVCLDQDALNSIFINDCSYLPDKYNRQVENYFHENKQKGFYENTPPGIWHFTGRNKPWISCNNSIGIMYWEYLLKSPWRHRTNAVLEEIIIKFSLEKLILDLPICNRRLFLSNLYTRLIHEVFMLIKSKFKRE